MPTIRRQPNHAPGSDGGSGERYLVTRVHSPALEGNPLGSPSDRDLRVYLPPGYHETGERYPVVYLLHGYGGDARHATVTTRQEFLDSFPGFVRWLLPLALRSVVFYERLDHLIRTGVLPAFILAQPDGSLQLPQLGIDRTRDTAGFGNEATGPRDGAERAASLSRPFLKGSMYYDSPGTGDYGRYVFGDVVDHVDRTYRTMAERSARFVAGASMGGYGALLAGIYHPDRFSAVAALSPSICGLDVLDLELVVPFLALSQGRAAARRDGRRLVRDILHTCDLVFSPDRPLVPTIRRDAMGRAVAMDEEARARWSAADAGRLAERSPGAFRDVRLRISCEQHDEFGFAGPAERLHRVLTAHGTPHRYVPFSDLRARLLSGHSAGIGLQVLPALRFLLTGSDAA